MQALLFLAITAAAGPSPPPPPSYDLQYHTMVHGDSLPGWPRHITANNTDACHSACIANPSCVGWVIDTPNDHCLVPTEPPGKSSCWLQSTWGMANPDPCRIVGLVREPSPLQIAVEVDMVNVTHRLRPLDMGCHSDTGYSHQPRNLYAQKIYGSSFEFDYLPAPGPKKTGAGWRPDGSGWTSVSVGAGNTDTRITGGTALHGQASVNLTFNGAVGSGRAAVANRGLGNEGLYLASKLYEGYLFVQAAKAVTITVSLESWSAGGAPRVLARSVLAFGGGNWTQLNFSLTPTKAAECNGLIPNSSAAIAANITCPVNGTYTMRGGMSDRTAHVCVQCGGQFVIALEEAGEVNLDFVYLAPADWGLFKGLPVLAEGVKWLQAMGTTLFRAGGSFACSSDMFWKQWRGKPWTRNSIAVSWGHDLEAGW